MQAGNYLNCIGITNNFSCQSNSEIPSGLENNGLNVRTYNFECRSYIDEIDSLPGELRVNGLCYQPCVMAHRNVIAVAEFIRDILMHDPPNGTQARYISSINCVQESGETEWENSCWLDDYEQAVFGQHWVKEQLHSWATYQDIVAHEFFHGLNYQIAKFTYLGESGALDESYADIFAILVTNRYQPDINQWNWKFGQGLLEGVDCIRDVENPSNCRQPDNMEHYDDDGGVHHNNGIHNRAAYNLITSDDGQGNFLFNANSAAQLFYLALRKLGPTSRFIDSRRAVVQAAKTLSITRWRNDSTKIEKLRAIEKAFDQVGIVE
ncbi:MAG: M4 family metallopeptidase [Symploca sp. SIO1C4]|uniref:Neutral metalloproteinase n=1 Tax=Symploca sp. SIO1C4 TaxID=2607765 RepID=A0A6B3NB17_9CYAN|nr:M4 family metallopeptidase [Symploca sp. SIO1C4]